MSTALKAAIDASGLKQLAIARRIEIHESRLSRIVNGRMPATPDEKIRLALTLNRSVDELFPPTQQAVA